MSWQSISSFPALKPLFVSLRGICFHLAPFEIRLLFAGVPEKRPRCQDGAERRVLGKRLPGGVQEAH